MKLVNVHDSKSCAERLVGSIPTSGTMNFLLIIIWEYILVAIILIAFFWRDQKNPKYFLGRRPLLAKIFIGVLGLGIIMALSSIFVYPNILIINNQEIKISKITQPINIALITDIQVGNNKKTAWVEKIVEKINEIRPDIILLGGDLIDNEAAFEDETQYLEPLAKLVDYPIYAVLGNHEYGIGSKTKENNSWQTGDRSEELVARFKKLNIPLLRNQLICPEVKNQQICIFGADDIWKKSIDFTELQNYNSSTAPLIFLTHNPDGILSWPKDRPAPDLVLVGHTHGGQVWMPGFGPLGLTDVDLGRNYYRGLNYWKNTPIFTSVGAGESGAPIRFWVTPEIAVIKIRP